MRTVTLLITALLVASSASAETNPLRWRGHEAVANDLSNGLIGWQLSAETTFRFSGPNRWRALRCEAVRLSVGFGASEPVKRGVQRERPNHADRKSFYSAHAQVAEIARGYSWPIGLVVAGGVALLRMGADEHYGSDVLVGLGAGELARRVCR